jgi:chorismate mutase
MDRMTANKVANLIYKVERIEDVIERLKNFSLDNLYEDGDYERIPEVDTIMEDAVNKIEQYKDNLLKELEKY